jgi:hypothetical protein
MASLVADDSRAADDDPFKTFALDWCERSEAASRRVAVSVVQAVPIASSCTQKLKTYSSKKSQQAAEHGPSQADAKAAHKTARLRGRTKRKTPESSDSKLLREVFWRASNSECNQRMQAAVWVYRFMPLVPSKKVQLVFDVAVKTLMRYVKSSCEPGFAEFGLYFGPAGQGVGGHADRALPKHQRAKQHDAEVLWSDPSVPAAALRSRHLLSQKK